MRNVKKRWWEGLGRISNVEPGEQSPEEHKSCPEDCPHYCPDFISHEDCPELECVYDKIDPETAAGMEYHALIDEGKLDEFGGRRGDDE